MEWINNLLRPDVTPSTVQLSNGYMKTVRRLGFKYVFIQGLVNSKQKKRKLKNAQLDFDKLLRPEN